MANTWLDEVTGALYLQLGNADIVETVELARDVYLDVDYGGQPVGVEILNADAALAALIVELPLSVDLPDVLRIKAERDRRGRT